MAQPPAYNRNKDFTEDFGNETDHSSLNAELDRASNSINDIRSNLAILQADDGKLRPAVVTADSISEQLRVSLVEGVVMDAQSMLDISLAAAEASSASAQEAKLSEERALESSSMACNWAKEAADSAEAIALAINSDWDATEGAAEILNKPALSAVALSGNYEDLSGKPDNLATDNDISMLQEDIAVLQEEIAKKGVPVGTIEYFAMTVPPAGYLKADGAAVGRETYPELFSAIGTTFGEGDGTSTFNLPDLINRFAQGSNTPGQKIEAGLPEIEGTAGGDVTGRQTGAFYQATAPGTDFSGATVINVTTGFKASLFNPIYGASDTVQPPALTLLPCIKAFDAATNPGLIDITELANEMAGKVDRFIDNKPVRYVIDTYSDGTNWYRKWSDGWLEQGGQFVATGGVGALNVINLNLPSFVKCFSWSFIGIGADGTSNTGAYTQTISTSINFSKGWGASQDTVAWYASGQGAQS